MPLEEVPGRTSMPRLAWVSLLILLVPGLLSGAEPGALDPGAVRSRLVVVRVGEGKDARSVVILGKPSGSCEKPDMENTRLDILPREFVRQAVLIAARDGLGLSTRDEVIDDSPTAKLPGPGATVEVVSSILGTRSREMIRRVKEGRVETLFTHETPTDLGRRLNLMQLLTSAEILSREGLPKALKGLGLEGKPDAVVAKSDLPDGVEAQLSGLGFPETVAALRDLHAAIKAEGESPERLGALVRGYAQLGVLSEFQWTPAHKAYKARALLYAQRMVARDAAGAWPLWHRAFALALAGRHQDALVDLATAAKKAKTKAPAWVELIDACARCDSGALAASPKDGPHAKLAALLRMTTLEFPRSNAVALQAAKDVVALDPTCFRAQDATCDYRGVTTQHTATSMGPMVLAQAIPGQIRSLAGLPESAKERIEAEASAAVLSEALDRAGSPTDDRGEPSWSALGHLVRETRFIQVWRRLDFLKHMLDVPAGDYWTEVAPDVAGHRYQIYLESFAVPPQELDARVDAFIDRFDLTDIESGEIRLISDMSASGRPRGLLAWPIAQCHDDETARDIALALAAIDQKQRPLLARDLLAISPRQPLARAVLIKYDWDKVKDQAAAWEKEGADSHVVLAELATRYSEEKRFLDVQRVLGQYINVSADLWAYRLLAANFKAQGRMDLWQDTLDEYLKNIEDLGLDHASVRVEVANYFMGLGQWEKAEPYAEAAAGTGAEWAMNCAGRCAEGQKDWERAETWFTHSAHRYPNSAWAGWYLFCKRTGQGNLAAAHEFADNQVATLAGRPDIMNRFYAGCYYWFDGRTKEAKVAFSEAYAKQPSISSGTCLALIADDEKDTARRDQILKEICTKLAEKSPKSVAICRTLLDTLFAPGGKKPIDHATLKQHVGSIPTDGRGNAEFFLGRFLLNHGEREAGSAYLRDASEATETTFWFRLLADEALKKSARD